MRKIRVAIVAGAVALGGLGAAAVLTAQDPSKPPAVHVDQVSSLPATTVPTVPIATPVPPASPVVPLDPAPIVKSTPKRTQETPQVTDPNPEHTIDTEVTPAGDDVPPSETPPPPPFSDPAVQPPGATTPEG